ncbi:unnamed protein product, partial [Musa hybrid cultivar]
IHQLIYIVIVIYICRWMDISWRVQLGKSPQELHLQPQPEDVVGRVQEKLLGGQLPPAGHKPTQLPHLPPQRTAYGEPPFPSMAEAGSAAARRSTEFRELVAAPSGRLLPSPPVHLR